ncbi:putative cell wall protein SPI1 [Metarhizium anisopliae]
MQTKALIFAAALVGSVVGQAPAPAPVELGAGSSKSAAAHSWEAPAPTAKPDHDWEHSSAASHEWHQASSSEAQHSWGSSADRHQNATVVTKTKVVSHYTTYCPEPTTVEIGNKMYTVTKPTTLTISECPCTITETHKKPHHTKEAPHTKEIPPPKPPVQTPAVPQPPPPAATTGVVVAGADGLTAAYGFAMAAAGLVGGVFAL